MICSNRVCDGLQQHGLAGARRRYDQSALPFAHWSEKVHHARTDVLAHGLLLNALLRIKRGQVVEEDLVARFIGRFKVDGFDLHQRKILLALVWRTHLNADGVTGFQVELTYLTWSYNTFISHRT